MIAVAALRTLGRRARTGPGGALLMQVIPHQRWARRGHRLVGQMGSSFSHLMRRAVGLAGWLFPRANAEDNHGIASSRASTATVDARPTESPITSASGLRVARLLSSVLALVMVAASIAGMGFRGLYREPSSVAAMLRGYDLVVLVVAVPLLVATLVPARRESPRLQLLWVSMLAYSAYNYAVYVFGTAFNAAFLLHVAAFSLSVYALALALAGLDIPGIARRFRISTPARLIAGVLTFLAAGLGGMWVFFSLRFAITGARPGESLLVLPLAGVHLGYVLDLALLVPAYAAAAVLLWRRAAWGYVLAGVLLPFTVVYQLNYVTALLFQSWAKVPGAVAFDRQEVPIIAATLAATVLLLRNLRDNNDEVGR